jgi:hypothetical protein
MDKLIVDLTNSNARLFLYVPSYLTIEQAARQVTERVVRKEPNTEISIVTLARSRIDGDHISSLQIGQITQTFMDIFFGLSSPRPTPPRILIIESSTNLAQFVVPRQIGRILVIGSAFKSMEDLTETSRFLSGYDTQNIHISPLQVGIFLGKIGYQITSNESEFAFHGLPVTVNMTSLQFEEYQQRVLHEQSLNRLEPFSALQALNMIYPNSLQLLHNLPRQQRPNITPDLLTNDGGWINSDVNVKELSPKINWLINYVRINPGKHVIYTAFNESNGVQAISSFLRAAGFNVINITGNERHQDRYIKLSNFNRPEITQIILISNLYAFSTINSVSSLIIFEQHPYDAVLNSYLREIANSGTKIISVIFLISIGPNGQSTLDVENYITMARFINQKDSILNILRTGQVDPSQLEQYRQAFGIPDLSVEYLRIIFTDETHRPIMFKPITLS